MYCYESVGEILRLQGDLAGALDAFATSVRIGLRRSELSWETFEGIAAVWVTLGHHEDAARLAGAAERIREQSGGLLRVRPRPPAPERIEPSWSEGRAMSPEEAAEYALSRLEEIATG